MQFAKKHSHENWSSQATIGKTNKRQELLKPKELVGLKYDISGLKKTTFKINK